MTMNKMDNEDLEEAKTLFDAINEAFGIYNQYKVSKAKRKEKEDLEIELEKAFKEKSEEELKQLFKKTKEAGFKGDYEDFLLKKDTPVKIYRRI